MALQAGFANIMGEVTKSLESSQLKKRVAEMSPEGSSTSQGANKSKVIPPLPGSSSGPPLNAPQSAMVSDMVQAALKSAMVGMATAIETHLMAASSRLDGHDEKHKHYDAKHKEAEDKMNWTNAQLVKNEEMMKKLAEDVGHLKVEAETSTARAILAEQALAAMPSAIYTSRKGIESESQLVPSSPSPPCARW